MTETRQMKLPLAAGVWSFVCLAGAIAGMWRGYGGRPFAVALATFAALFAVQVGFAAEGVTDRLAARLDSVRATLPIAPVLVYLVYALATGVFGWRVAGIALVYAIAPAALLLSAGKGAK